MNVISKNFNMSPSPQVLDHVGGYLSSFDGLEHMLDNFHIYKMCIRHTKADILSAHRLLVLNSLTKSSLKTQSCHIKMYVNVYSYVHLQYRKSKSQMYVWYIVV